MAHEDEERYDHILWAAQAAKTKGSSMTTLSTVAAFFESYSAAWSANDAEAIAAHWSNDDPTMFYKAEENLSVITTFDGIKAYWAHNETFHERVRLIFTEPTLMPLPGGYHFGFIKMRWDIKFKAAQKMFEGSDFEHGGKAMGGENHTFILLREVDGDIKLCGWSETPDAPITYMSRLYEWAASPDFRAS